MGAKTDRFGLNTLGPGDSMADDGFKFSDGDIQLIDRLLQLAVEGHHHTGEAAVDNTPASPPTLYLTTTGGGLPSSTRFFYRFTLVDAQGNETLPSPVVFQDTPIAVPDPAAPSLSYLSSGGLLDPGNYSYVLSAYTTATTLESRAANSAYITVAIPTSVGRVSIEMPPLPSGATGFNIYRKAPNGARYQYLDSTTGTTYIDDGSVAPDCDRSLPAINTTNNTSIITITYPGSTPVVPVGFTWKIYRTTNPNNWANSLLHHVVETTGATPVVNIAFSDVGGATSSGQPPTTTQLIGNPSKILLTDAAEIQGMIPPGLVLATKTIEFTASGPVVAGPGSYTWLCPYDQAHITGVRAHLGVDSWPAATDVIVDVNKWSGASWDTIFPSSPQPTVPVGWQNGALFVPDVTSLVAGDMLSVDVDQAGGGATPTDQNLVITVIMLVKDGSSTVSPTFA